MGGRFDAIGEMIEIEFFRKVLRMEVHVLAIMVGMLVPNIHHVFGKFVRRASAVGGINLPGWFCVPRVG